MTFSQEQKTFMIESYFRNGCKIDGEWIYNIPDCFEEFRNEFSEIRSVSYN
ncbi:hypothetical protein BDFB_014950 [Asbolus verrucosus]|uniref:Uncharacterized protein n=1 Tax=Asbolus verrucosus TaxID=1661398 RepID=A0A482WE53_ASBVE|nr:hypothetical protein BDFB_014931 [Asbolus verrucosus]RZC42989.1 hypothetical protein BDFB_014950 [Asbolus verrucosus]